MAFPDFTPTVPAFLRRLVERHGPRECIVGERGRPTYAEVELRSAALARGLLAAGVGKGTHVGLLLPNGPDWVVSWLATTRIGAVAVPINTFFRTRELAWILRHADVHTLLGLPRFLGHDYLARLEEIAPGLRTSGDTLAVRELPHLRAVYALGEDADAVGSRRWVRDGSALAEGAGVDAAVLEEAEACVTPADPMVLLYSSGSTADPKGAVHGHGGVLRHSYNLSTLRDVKADDRVWSPMPFFWVGGFVFALLGNLQVGACTLCEDVFEPGKTLRFLERERATIAIGWPHFGKALAEHPTRRERDLSALRAGNVPDLLPPEVCPRETERRGNALGMTETCGPHTWGGDGLLPERLWGSFGKAVPGVAHKVVDPETGRRLGPGESGEICVKGYSLMQGLYKVERDQVFDDEGFYHTGDGGCFDEDGVLWFEARLGDMIKTGGANVTPSEVEAAIHAYDGVKAAYVVGVPDPGRGQVVAAAVVPEVGASLSADALVERLRGDLSAYKVPRLVWLASESELPFTDSGKIDKRSLARLLGEPGRPGRPEGASG